MTRLVGFFLAMGDARLACRRWSGLRRRWVSLSASLCVHASCDCQPYSASTHLANKAEQRMMGAGAASEAVACWRCSSH